MKELIKEMIKHPIAAMIIVGCATSGVADIIRAVKGVSN